ncbi:SGT1 protein-domain-containing protein [Helicostylum pulchrum]|nr:SGT1 protein-domain-containing protein [Helicostylum pulchrum]
MDTLQDVFKGSSAKEIDYVQYAIYLPSKETESDTHSYLQDTLAMINSLIQPLIKDYIWHKDRFHLSITYDQSNDPSYPFLFGITRFGDCLNDEWFIVYLLKTISSQLTDAVISISDNDGDVLLIEAALELPSWLDPSNSENRVYMYRGQVYIIPLPKSPADILQVPTSGHLLRQKAIPLVRHTCPAASDSIQHAINQRISEYPSAAQQEIHRAKCLLPSKAAFVLLSEPQLITLAVEAFYLRDPISMKACASMRTFSPVNTVETVVRFTKTTYAQTVSQKFYAPKPFRLPAMNQKRQYKYAELGMKVACGLEMLYHISEDDTGNSNDDIETYDFEHDKKYTAYITHLTKLGYFRSERPGSKLYNLLQQQSKEQYLQYKKQDSDKRVVSLDDIDVDDDDTFKGSDSVLSNGTSLVRKRIDDLLSQYSEEKLQLLLDQNTDSEELDDWMNVDPQQLEEMLMKRMGNIKESMMDDLKQDFEDDDLENGGMDLEAMMSNLENFVENKKSGIDGVEFPREMTSDDDDEDSDEDKEEEYSDDDEYQGPIKFDMDKFMSILKGESSFKQEEEENMTDVMQEMDQEISSHDKISGSFAKLTTNEENEEQEDENAPVDVQLNLVKNVLESFKSQQGLPGPVGNILTQFGFVLPGDNEEKE